jgi:hypothetical protein
LKIGPVVHELHKFWTGAGSLSRGGVGGAEAMLQVAAEA